MRSQPPCRRLPLGNCWQHKLTAAVPPAACERRFYRYDGKGNLSQKELAAFDAGRTFEDGYAKYTSDPLTYKPEEKIIQTDRGEKVRSKSEKIIADKLFALGISYRYEASVHLRNNRVYYPDITVQLWQT